MTRILKLQVADQVSTLNRITSAFVRLQYNIDTLHVTHSEQPGISNMEIQVDIQVDIQDDTSLHILIKKLKQQINVLTVECYDLVDNEA
ncbi:ACT domain-containing protein [Staphylococcus aureus]|uniref:ACT domain-containing protein n=2 Tax=Staphylococcus aureus TaxID=1280 RepID=UPI00263E387E|nr:ACT domain-containing protein [Staphylococcus aureus]MDN5240072.1 ACT domain-containing protein [Staphylococcus aureus]